MEITLRVNIRTGLSAVASICRLWGDQKTTRSAEGRRGGVGETPFKTLLLHNQLIELDPNSRSKPTEGEQRRRFTVSLENRVSFFRESAMTRNFMLTVTGQFLYMLPNGFRNYCDRHIFYPLSLSSDKIFALFFQKSQFHDSTVIILSWPKPLEKPEHGAPPFAIKSDRIWLDQGRRINQKNPQNWKLNHFDHFRIGSKLCFRLMIIKWCEHFKPSIISGFI